MTTDMSRLYGLPDGEHLCFDLAEAIETLIDPFRDGATGEPWEIEEWSVYPPIHHFPGADDVIEWVAEWTAENGELDHDGVGADAIHDRVDDEVTAAFQAALDLWASKVTFRMANKRLRTIEITWGDNGDPLADGEPVYKPAKETTS